MKFKVDENLPAEAAELLQQAGHDAVTAATQHLSGATDEEILSVCRREGRSLVTLDLGFADIRTYPPAQCPGLVVLRLKRQDKLFVLQVLARLVPVLAREPLARHLWIVDEERIRVRG